MGAAKGLLGVLHSHVLEVPLLMDTIGTQVALVTSLIGAFAAVFFFFSEVTVHPVDYIATSFLSWRWTIFSTAFWGRVPVNLIDKGIAVFATFGVYQYVRR